MTDARAVTVPLAGRPYDVHVGAGLLERVGELFEPPRQAARIVVVTSPGIDRLYGDGVVSSLRSTGLDVDRLLIDDGEPAKSVETLQRCWDFFGELPVGRRDVVVALGGGVIGDLAGFAAATWNRGIAVVQVATTVVAQVDSAIGGKTGINTPAGKNLVGAFHQPLAVVDDVGVLATLPAREVRAGLGEVVKCGFIADPVLLELLQDKDSSLLGKDTDLLADLVYRSAAVKAEVVGGDEREAGRRELLNYGHTLGHALETLTGYRDYLHGEAVAVGMVFAARLGERLGVSGSGLADRTVGVLESLGLPTAPLAPFAVDEVWSLLARDKKARGGVRFVLVPAPGSAVVADPPDPGVVRDELRRFSDLAPGR